MAECQVQGTQQGTADKTPAPAGLTVWLKEADGKQAANT